MPMTGNGSLLNLTSSGKLAVPPCTFSTDVPMSRPTRYSPKRIRKRFACITEEELALVVIDGLNEIIEG